jgi:aryl-alcohol dehydrogenase-like predicted oxidoreductase
LKLAIGTVQLGINYGINNQNGIPKEVEIKNIFDLAISNKITMLDTASGYGDAEIKIGKESKQRFKIISKFSNINEYNSIEQELYNSLKNTRSKSLYGYLAHNANEIIDNTDLWGKLKEFKEKGLINKIGFSLYDPIQLGILLSKNIIPDLVQIPYSILDRKFEPFFDKLKKLNVEIHARSIFLQGLYFMNINKLPQKLLALKEPLTNINSHCIKNSVSINDFALNFVYGNNFIDYLVLGIEKECQLKHNINSINNWEFDHTIFDMLKKINPDSYLTNPSNW